jgi:hypothetical protein
MKKLKDFSQEKYKVKLTSKIKKLFENIENIGNGTERNPVKPNNTSYFLTNWMRTRPASR